MAVPQETTGFQSPCTEYAEDLLSLDRRYLTNPSATFFVRVLNDSKFLNLYAGDILLINRALVPTSGDLVVAVITNNFVLGTFAKINGVDFLLPFNKKLGDVELEEDFLWGVAEIQIRHRRKKRAPK